MEVGLPQQDWFASSAKALTPRTMTQSRYLGSGILPSGGLVVYAVQARLKWRPFHGVDTRK